MNSVAKNIRETKAKIAKLEKHFPKGKINPCQAFTVDLSFDGNNHADVERIVVGSLYTENFTGAKLVEFLLENLRASLKFWEHQARGEMRELSELLTPKVDLLDFKPKGVMREYKNHRRES